MNRDEQLKLWIKEYSNRLARFAYTYVRDRGIAEDIVQESFIKAYRSMHQMHDIEAPFSWLVRIVLNECRTNHRKRRWREIITKIAPERSEISTEDVYVRYEEFQDVHNAILSLPETYRTPIVLFYFQDLSTDQIAKILGINPGTVRTRLNRGRNYLHKQLKRGGQSEFGTTNPRSQTLR